MTQWQIAVFSGATGLGLFMLFRMVDLLGKVVRQQTEQLRVLNELSNRLERVQAHLLNIDSNTSPKITDQDRESVEATSKRIVDGLLEGLGLSKE